MLGSLRTRVKVWRPSEIDGALRSRQTVFTDSGSVWLELGQGTRGLRDFGAGEEVLNTSVARTDGLNDVRAEDVLEATAGPEAGTKWKVLGVDRTSVAWRGLALETFTGPITEAP